MKVFISSVIAGFEPFREAVSHAVRTLRHDLSRAEDFGDSPDSPQQVCLAGVRKSDVVVLILGARYGYLQHSGLSATHEEFRETRDTKDVLVFVQQGVAREEAQQTFLREVQSWAKGKYTDSFATFDELQSAVIRALHQLELTRAAGRADEEEVLTRGQKFIAAQRNSSLSTLAVVVAGGPRQRVLRPAKLEDTALAANLKQKAVFGDVAILSSDYGTQARVQGHRLTLVQERAEISVDEQGTVGIVLPARSDRNSKLGGVPNVLIEEDIQDRIEGALRFAVSVLEEIDPVHRLSDVVPVVALLGASYHGWKTRTEYQANPNRTTIGMTIPERFEVSLAPALRSRTALIHDAASMVEDFTVLIRRRWRP